MRGGSPTWWNGRGTGWMGVGLCPLADGDSGRHPAVLSRKPFQETHLKKHRGCLWPHVAPGRYAEAAWGRAYRATSSPNTNQGLYVVQSHLHPSSKGFQGSFCHDLCPEGWGLVATQESQGRTWYQQDPSFSVSSRREPLRFHSKGGFHWQKKSESHSSTSAQPLQP